ncbi:MAG: ABC transporter permease [Thiolinea sp.]
MNGPFSLPFVSLGSRATLFYRLWRRDLQERYTGTWLGWFWLVLHPCSCCCCIPWCLVKSAVRFGAATSTGDFAVYLFAGLLAFNAFAEVVTRAPVLLSERRDLLRNTPLPPALLPLLPVATSVVLEGLALLILLLALLGRGELQVLTLLYYWPFLLIRVLLSMAAAYLLAPLGVFLRDLRQMVPVLLTVLLFTSPILYPLEVIPERFLGWYDWNLFGQLVQGYRDALLLGQLDGGRCLGLLLVALLLLAFAVSVFRSLMTPVRQVL